MEIRPSNNVLFALSTQQVDPSRNQGQNLRTDKNEAARQAARAVFAQLSAPPKAAATPAASALTPAPASPTLPSTPPNRPVPRGTYLNILV